MRIFGVGCSGLIGRALVPALLEAGHELRLSSRDPASAAQRLPLPQGSTWVRWDGRDADALSPLVEGCDAAVNLAGRNIADQRWSDRFKQELRSSRLEPTQALSRVLPGTEVGVLVQASAIGLYGDAAEPIDETAPAGDDYMARLCRDWEASAEPVVEAGIRLCCLRIAPVLAPPAEGGMLSQFIPPWPLPLGWLGTGRQPLAWIHRLDLVGMIRAALEASTDAASWRGPVHAVAPERVDQRAFTRALGRASGRPVMPFGAPGLAAHLLVGELAEHLLVGQNALPSAAEGFGYQWRFASLDAALGDVLSRES